SEQRRSAVPVIVDVQLEGVVGALADVHAAEAPVQVSGDVGGLSALQVLTVRGLDVRRHLIQRQTEARQRRGFAPATRRQRKRHAQKRRQQLTTIHFCALLYL